MTNNTNVVEFNPGSILPIIPDEDIKLMYDSGFIAPHVSVDSKADAEWLNRIWNKFTKTNAYAGIMKQRELEALKKTEMYYAHQHQHDACMHVFKFWFDTYARTYTLMSNLCSLR